MNFTTIGKVHQHESRVLFELARNISAMAREYRETANFYFSNPEIKLTRNQHKVLSYLYSVYFLDSQNESSWTWITTKEITDSVNVDVRGDWARLNCHKLLKMNFIAHNNEGKWYIAKYGIFYMHCEVNDQDWPEDLIHNASTGALEKDLRRILGEFIQNKIKETNEKFEKKGNSK